MDEKYKLSFRKYGLVHNSKLWSIFPICHQVPKHIPKYVSSMHVSNKYVSSKHVQHLPTHVSGTVLENVPQNRLLEP